MKILKEYLLIMIFDFISIIYSEKYLSSVNVEKFVIVTVPHERDGKVSDLKKDSSKIRDKLKERNVVNIGNDYCDKKALSFGSHRPMIGKARLAENVDPEGGSNKDVENSEEEGSNNDVEKSEEQGSIKDMTKSKEEGRNKDAKNSEEEDSKNDVEKAEEEGSNKDMNKSKEEGSNKGVENSKEEDSNNDVEKSEKESSNKDMNKYKKEGSNKDVENSEGEASNKDLEKSEEEDSNKDMEKSKEEEIIKGVNKSEEEGSNKESKEEGSKSVEKSEEEGRNKDMKKSDDESSKKDMDKSEEEGRNKDMDKSENEDSDKDLKKSEKDGSKKEVEKSEEEGSNKDMNKSKEEGTNKDVEKSEEEGSKKEGRKSDEEGSNKNVEKSKEESSNKDLKIFEEGGNKHILKSEKEGSNKDVAKSEEEGSNEELEDQDYRINLVQTDEGFGLMHDGELDDIFDEDSRPGDKVKTTHVHLDLEIDFEEKVLIGHAILTMEKVDPKVDVVFFYASHHVIHSINEEATGDILKHQIDGKKIKVRLPTSSSKEFKVRLNYSTSSNSSGLQWLNPVQTAGKKHPFLFSQGLTSGGLCSIHPCQDTHAVKATFTASITAPAHLTVLMSAVRDGVSPITDDDKKISKFNQKVKMSSYLIAIAAGNLQSRKIGPRSHVWSEPEHLEEAAFDFADTEDMLKAGEELCGPYVWDIYDILVMPPSFAYGGMENPCLTFASPTLLTGDKANADIIAHEIAHSWGGNLVTNVNSTHVWLSEGFATFIERKILGRIHGEPVRHLRAILKWRELENAVNVSYDKTGLLAVDMDNDFSTVAYEKGSAFLWYLEDTVGGADRIDKFLKAYFKKFAYQAIYTKDFKSFFLEHFSNVKAVKKIDWNTWINKPGMPISKPNFDYTLANASRKLADDWENWDLKPPAPLRKEFEKMSSMQQQEFLDNLIEGDPLDHSKLEKMGDIYRLDNSSNVEILLRWIRLGIKAKWEPSAANALSLVTKQFRVSIMKFVYKDLYDWEEKRQQAIDTFLAHKEELMEFCRTEVAKELHLLPKEDTV